MNSAPFPIKATQLLPQKFPFQMVDELLSVIETKVNTSFTIQEDNVLLCNNYFSEGGLLENMAQSAAAGSGYSYLLKEKDVPKGYIGAMKHIVINKLPRVGSTIETTLETLHQIANATIVQAKIFLEKELIASGELTIFVSP